MERLSAQGQLRPSRLSRAAHTVLALALAAPLLAQAGACVREADTVRVAGRVTRQRMTHLVDERASNRLQRDNVVSLVLRDPLCVMLPDDVSLALRPRTVTEVQLLHHERLPSGRDAAVLIDGKVMLASNSAHHHPVLVDIAGLPSNRASAPVVAPAPTSRQTTLAIARFNH